MCATDNITINLFHSSEVDIDYEVDLYYKKILYKVFIIYVYYPLIYMLTLPYNVQNAMRLK